MELFNWYKIKNLNKYLSSPEMDDVKEKTADFIAASMANTSSKEAFEDETYLGEGFFEDFHKMSTKDQIKTILERGFMRFSFVENPEYYKTHTMKFKQDMYYQLVFDYVEYQRLNDVKEYENIKSLGHWCYHHGCVQISPFVYRLVSLIFPHKKFKFAGTKDHTFVVCPDEPTVIYDITWFINGIGRNQIQELENYKILSKTYDQMVNFELCGTE